MIYRQRMMRNLLIIVCSLALTAAFLVWAQPHPDKEGAQRVGDEGAPVVERDQVAVVS